MVKWLIRTWQWLMAPADYGCMCSESNRTVTHDEKVFCESCGGRVLMEGEWIL